MRAPSKMKSVRLSSRFCPPLLCITESWSRAFAKIVLSLLGVFLWGAAVAFLFGAAFVMLTYKNYRFFFQSNLFLVPGWLAVLATLLLFPTGALAVYAPVKHSRQQQGTLMYFLVVLLCLEASAAVMTQLYSAKVSYQLKNSMDNFFQQYNRTVPTHHANEAVDTIHRQLKCCGVYNYTDWIMVAVPDHFQAGHPFVPKSCCKETYLDCTGDMSQQEKLFEEGCLRKLQGRLHFIMHYVIWCCVVVCCLEILAVILNGVLMKEQPFQDLRILDSAAFS